MKTHISTPVSGDQMITFNEKISKEILEIAEEMVKAGGESATFPRKGPALLRITTRPEDLKIRMATLAVSGVDVHVGIPR